MITIVVTTYNRADIVETAILSALQFVSGLTGEVILVDDGSVDRTTDVISAKFDNDIRAGRLKVIHHLENRGVTAAKNTGFDAARCQWVGFLDSDDQLIPAAATAFRDGLLSSANAPVVFFRCIDEHGEPVGRTFLQPQVLDFARFVKHVSYGEALVVVNKKLTGSPPFDADLRGYEGLGCARLIRDFGAGRLFPNVVRIYNRSGSDRLSSFKGMLKRASLIGLGHYRLLKLCDHRISTAVKIRLWIKAVAYLAVGTLHEKLTPGYRGHDPDDHTPESSRR